MADRASFCWTSCISVFLLPPSCWAVSIPRCSIADPTDGHLTAPRSGPAGVSVQGLRQSRVVVGQAPTWGSGEGPLGTGDPLTLRPPDLGWAQHLSRAYLIRSGPPRVTSLFWDLLFWGLSCNSHVPSSSTEQAVGMTMRRGTRELPVMVRSLLGCLYHET